MNKSDLVQALADEMKVPVKTALSIVDTTFGAMAEALVTGDNVEIRGFGSFTVRQHGSYMGRKPRTGETIEVKPKKTPFFKVGKELKKAVRNGGGGKKS